jgi:hypothetical protein
MMHLLAILATTYVPACTLDTLIGSPCVIDHNVWQYRCIAAAHRQFVCDRRIKRPTKHVIPT